MVVDWVVVSVLAGGTADDVTGFAPVSDFGGGVLMMTGAVTSVFCSHAPKSAALARMQINFFIVVDYFPVLGLSLNRNKVSFRSC